MAKYVNISFFYPKIYVLSNLRSSSIDAIRDGQFKDDDYSAVRNLDTIAGGNLHRQNRERRREGEQGLFGGSARPKDSQISNRPAVLYDPA
jgi:hypothetical protein